MKKLLFTAFILSGIAVTTNAQTESKLKTPVKQVVHPATAVKKASPRNFVKKTDADVVNGTKQRPTAARPVSSVAKKKTLTKEMLKKQGITKENLKPE